MIRFLVLFSLCCGSHSTAQIAPEPGEAVGAYLDRYEQWIETISVDNRSWPHIEALIENTELYQQLGAIETDPSQDGWADSVALIDEHPELLRTVRLIASRPRLGIPRSTIWEEDFDPESGPPSIWLALPHLSVLGKCQQLFVVDTRLAVERGDFERALLNLESSAGIQAQIPLSGAMIEMRFKMLIGASVTSLILDDDLRLSEWDDEHLDRLTSVISSLSVEPLLEHMTRFEHWGCLGLIEWLYTDSQDGRLTEQGVDRFLNMIEMMAVFEEGEPLGGQEDEQDRLLRKAIIRGMVRSETDQIALAEELFGQIETDFSKPAHMLDAFQASERVEELSTGLRQGLPYGPVVIFIPAFDRLYKRYVHAEAKIHAAMMLVELTRYHAKHGVYPKTTDNYLDPFSGESLRFRLIDGHFMIYSVGTDRDDDSGRALVDASGDPLAWHDFIPLNDLELMSSVELDEIDGDWVLYPSAD